MLLDIEKTPATPQLPHFTDHLDCDIFLTQTIAPSLYHKTSREIYKQTKQKFEEILRRHTKKYLCVMELTKQGIPHYHVILTFKDNDLDPIMYLDSIKSLRDQPLGHSVIKPITDIVELSDYMMKDLKTNKTHRIINTANKMTIPVYFSSKDTQPKTKFNVREHYIKTNEITLDSGIDDLDDPLTCSHPALELIQSENHSECPTELLRRIFINVKK